MTSFDMTNAFDIVKHFETAVGNYAGAPYCVAVNSCTNALFLALKYQHHFDIKQKVEIPKRTYVSVPMQIMHAGFQVKFRDEDWRGSYELKPFNIWDSARRFTKDMFGWEDKKLKYECVSFHWSKILGIQQGGAILHNDKDFDRWARKARFDGRLEGVSPQAQAAMEAEGGFDMLGWHMYMSPEIAAEGLVRMMHMKPFNEDLPNDAYPDLSQLNLFRVER